MKKSKTSKIERCQIVIQRPHVTLPVNMEKNHKQYVPPIAELTRKSPKLEPPPKPDRKVYLSQNFFMKKDIKQLSGRDVCLTLCRFPEYFENMKTAAMLLLLILLSQVTHLFIGILPALPVIFLNAEPLGIAPVLKTLLNAVQGPDKWSGDDWNLRRPWIVQPRLALGDTKPSVSVIDYIGGYYIEFCEGKLYALDKKERKFCFPFINSTFVLMPSLPASVGKSIISLSPLSMPIMFERSKRVEDRITLELIETPFDAYDANGIKKLAKQADSCFLAIVVFLKWFCAKGKRINRWKDGIDRFRPVSHRGRFTQPKSDTKTEFLCAALSLLQQFLYFASELAEWITPDEANDFLLQYWRLVLPESAPCENNGEAASANLAYDTPEIFYRFLLEEYLPTYRNQIIPGVKGEPGTMGLARELDGASYFIAPRKRFLESYAQWLTERHAAIFDLSASKGEAMVQRQLLEAGIPLRGERNNPATWRYPFYGKKAGMVSCFALPIRQLPESVQAAFKNQIGEGSDTTSVPNQSEPLPDNGKGAEAL